MSQQKTTRQYWKDALRHLRQSNLEEQEAAVRQHKWATAFHQAQADLKAPSAVVWLPEEIADVIRGHPAQEPPPALTRRQRLKTLLLALFLLIPAAISYLLAYRRIAAHLR
jgi:hypothetical protein